MESQLVFDAERNLLEVGDHVTDEFEDVFYAITRFEYASWPTGQVADDGVEFVGARAWRSVAAEVLPLVTAAISVEFVGWEMLIFGYEVGDPGCKEFEISSMCFAATACTGPTATA